MPIAVKICGITNEDAAHAVIAARADYAGFVYFPASPRHVLPARAAELSALLPSSIQPVLVLVDPDDELLEEVSSTCKQHALQLHGKETPERIATIRNQFPKTKIIKAIPVATSDDIATANRYADVVDMLLFDAHPAEMPEALPGGNGQTFDWALLKNRDFGKPWFLSGGLNAENVHAALTSSGAQMVDVSSSVESAPGIKDPALINAFVKAARGV